MFERSSVSTALENFLSSLCFLFVQKKKRKEKKKSVISFSKSIESCYIAHWKSLRGRCFYQRVVTYVAFTLHREATFSSATRLSGELTVVLTWLQLGNETRSRPSMTTTTVDDTTRCKRTRACMRGTRDPFVRVCTRVLFYSDAQEAFGK